MRQRIRPLIIFLLIVAVIQPVPAPADIKGAAGNAAGFAAGLLRLPLPPDTPESLKTFGDPGPKTVTSMALDLTAVTFSHTPPRVMVTASAIDPAGTAYVLNRLYAPAPARPAGYATDRFAIPGTLSHYRATPVSSLTLAASWAGGNVVSSAQVLLGQVTVTNWDNTQSTVRPTPNDVQWLPAGATYPVAPLIDPATGGFRVTSEASTAAAVCVR
jgi:hypothetical protein